MDKLNVEKQQIISNALQNGLDFKEAIQEIDDKINEADKKLEMLLDINNN